MGSMLTCCPWHRFSAEYEPLNDARGLTIGADPSRVQAIADVDEALLRDPRIREALEGDSDDPPLNEDELNRYLTGLNPQ
jgi:hypothetical protein